MVYHAKVMSDMLKNKEKQNVEENFFERNKKKIVIGTVVVLLMAIIGFFLYRFTENMALSETSDNVEKVFNEAKVNKPTGKNPTIDYSDNKVSIPSLDELRELQDEVVSGRYPVVKKGVVAIPALNIQSPIYEGTNRYTLSVGVGTAKAGQKAGQKNYALAGHNMTKAVRLKNYFFTNFQKGLASSTRSKNDRSYLSKVAGKKAYVTDDKYVYEYKLVKSEIINYKQGEVISDDYKVDGDKPVLTMYTCFERSGVAKPSDRILVQGVLEKKYTIKEFKETHKGTHIFETPSWLKGVK